MLFEMNSPLLPWPAFVRLVCKVAVLCLIGLPCGFAADPRASVLQAKIAALQGRPNIIFILADDLGYGELGCYGQEKIKTPHLDKLASEGMRFTQFYAGSPVCAPSRAVLMTGLHVGHVSIRGNGVVPLATNETTIAELLHDAGYQTAIFGKWGLGLTNTPSTPDLRGFDEWLGFLDQNHAHDYYPGYVWRSSKLSAEIEPLQPTVLAGNQNGAHGLYVHDVFTRAATNFIRGAKYKPFLLYLPYTIPHANNELKDQGMQVPSDAPYTGEAWPQAEKNKAAMITRLDHDVGSIMAQLKSLRLESNTVVFFASDNGPHKEGGVNPDFFKSSGALRGIKRDVYEGGIRVPMIARWPGKIPAGISSTQIWSFCDFLPTAAEIAGLTPPHHIDGISMLPALLGKRQTNQHSFVYWEFHEKGSRQAIRSGNWKAIRLSPGLPLELYDLQSDLGETNNVAAANPSVVKRLDALLKSARSESAHWPLRAAAQQAAARKAQASQ
ncbi:MAG: hypothetical protein QOF48_3465 [Verrucomicrobiota bacterium]|jgi:arylsulfatase A-like enzyme